MLLSYELLERLRICTVTLFATFSLVVVSHFNTPSSAKSPDQTTVSAESAAQSTSYPVKLNPYMPSLFTVPSDPDYMQPVDPSTVVEEFDPVEMYVHTVYGSLNVREAPSSESEIVGTLEPGDKVSILTDPEKSDYVEIQFEGNKAFIHSDYVSTEVYIPPKVVAGKKVNAIGKSKKSYVPLINDGSALTKQRGVVTGPSGKETYYNLNMSKVVASMKSRGVQGDYWVREDGAKMLGDYILVAANLDLHPRGSLVETSMGTGIVADTGTFAASNPNQIDIATAW